MRLGFNEHIRGDHFIFTKEGVEEILNLQPKGAKTKAYQIKQVRGIMLIAVFTRVEYNIHNV